MGNLNKFKGRNISLDVNKKFKSEFKILKYILEILKKNRKYILVILKDLNKITDYHPNIICKKVKIMSLQM